MGFEESLIRFAAPTLAGLKVANLYNYRFNSKAECLQQLHDMNMRLNSKGIFIELMKRKDDFYLIYVYRKTLLLRNLLEADIQLFLKACSYRLEANLDSFIEQLKNRINSDAAFPHEIGVFLGYPLADVKAFIEKKGADCIFCGEWKVYNDVSAARCTFCKLNHCKEIYVKVYNSGRNIYDMTVRA